jgi:hypothetical protein
VRIDHGRRRAEGWVASSLLEAAPGLVARTLLEAPVSVLLSQTRLQVLHAGAVVGPRGAVVLRGGSGAGKSTLVAALWRAGLGVLADESLLVAPEDPDDLSAAVRDLTLLPDSASLLDLAPPLTEPAFSGGESKHRVDLFRASKPLDRTARRVATCLLGAREPGPARLSPLSPDGFHAAFRTGDIPEERRTRDPIGIATSWAGRGCHLLEGASDLAGAVRLIQGLVHS